MDRLGFSSICSILRTDSLNFIGKILNRLNEIRRDEMGVNFLNYFFQIVGCISEKSGGMRVNAMQMKDMNTGRSMPHQFETRKDAAVSIASLQMQVLY